jgi:DNA modification methylase
MEFNEIIKSIQIKPYYEDDSVVIYNQDCRLVLPLIPDKSVDLVLTDPPYGIDYQSSWRTDNQRKDKIYGDKEFPLWIFDFNPRIAMLIWCRWDILSILPKPKSFIVWDKLVHSMGDLDHEFGRQWEAIAFYPSDEHEFIYRPVDVIRCMRISPDKLVHPNEKPAGAITPLIASQKGDLILDPFLGSGTTAYCAKKLGRKCIGIEISEKYCEISAKRCSQTVMNLEVPKEEVKTERLI